MEKLLPPYRIEISTSILCIYFDKIVTADVFFANCADIQQILEEGTYLGHPFQNLYVDFSKCESIVKRRKKMTNDAVRMRMTLWKKNSSNYTAPFANAMIADL